MNTEDTYFYGEYAKELDRTCADLATLVLDVIDGQNDASPAAYEHVKCRVKDEQSVKAKLESRGYDTTASAALTHLSDVIGVRIIAKFIGDVYAIADIIKQSDKIDVIEVQDYIVSPKESGYRSLHLEVKVPFAMVESGFISAEIQLRTIAMDCWASLEHQLRYKKDVPNAELVAEELRRCADEMASTDLSMQAIKTMIEDGR